MRAVLASIGGAGGQYWRGCQWYATGHGDFQRKCGVSSKKCGQLKENDRNDQESNEFGARVEVKRESPSSTPIEDWDDRPANNYLPEAENWDKEANESSYTIESRNLVIPAYRTVRRVAWGESCAACGGRPLRCACST